MMKASYRFQQVFPWNKRPETVLKKENDNDQVLCTVWKPYKLNLKNKVKFFSHLEDIVLKMCDYQFKIYNLSEENHKVIKQFAHILTYS